MRRFPIRTAAAATLALTGSFAAAQTPLFPRTPVRIAGVRAGDAYAQAPQPVVPGLPAPMPPGVAPMNPMGVPMGVPPGQPMNPKGNSTGMPLPRETAPQPGATTFQPGMQPGVYSMPNEVYPGMGGQFPGGADTFGNAFSYLNDAPPGMDYGPLGRPVLGRFVQPGKWYSSAEYLYWWTKPSTLPTLLTTSSAADNGFLGAGSTRTLLGGDSFGENGHSGGRFALGYWFGLEQRWGIDANFFFLANNETTFSTASGGNPLLARPFTNANTGGQFSQIIAFPGQSSGTFAAVQNSSLWGGDVNLRRFLTGTPCRRLDLLLGFKYLNLDEDLTLTETVARSPNGFPGIAPNAASAVVTDSFQTNNRFYGGQIGLIAERRRGRWYLDSTLKVALGQMQQSSTINGSQVVQNVNGTTSTFAGGLLALQGANIGTFSQNKFAVIPEATVNLGYHVTPRLRVFVGYNLLYVSSVLRPADQIDTTIDTTRIPNFATTAARLATPSPSPALRDSTFFAQGISVGLQFKW